MILFHEDAGTGRMVPPPLLEQMKFWVIMPQIVVPSVISELVQQHCAVAFIRPARSNCRATLDCTVSAHMPHCDVPFDSIVGETGCSSVISTSFIPLGSSTAIPSEKKSAFWTTLLCIVCYSSIVGMWNCHLSFFAYVSIFFSNRSSLRGSYCEFIFHKQYWLFVFKSESL